MDNMWPTVTHYHLRFSGSEPPHSVSLFVPFPRVPIKTVMHVGIHLELCGCMGWSLFFRASRKGISFTNAIFIFLYICSVLL